VRDGIVRLIEVNPRFSVTADAAIYAGVPIGWLYYESVIGKSVAPVAATRFDFRHIVLRRHVPVVFKLHEEGLIGWGDALRSFRSPVVYWDFDLHDWRVTAETLTACAKTAVRWALRRGRKQQTSRG
jgi:D-aspartate ligase